MTDQHQANYPDILGAITSGPRLTFDVIQCALAVRPAQVPAGQLFEIVLLVQNTSDIDVDVVVTPILPQQDANRQKGRFTTKSPRLRVGLRPAEVGFVTLPLSTSPKTAPASDYEIGVDFDIKRMGKRPQRIRQPGGGGTFVLQELSLETQGHIEVLRKLQFVADAGGKKNTCRATFEVQPPALASLQNLRPDWVSLWTMRDYMDEYTIAQKVWVPAQSVRGNLRRDVVFMPLLKATQERFQQCNYKLHPPEAIYITKLLTLILELGVIEPTDAEPRPVWPHWFSWMCRLLFQEPALASQIEPLITRLLYGDLVSDAIMYAFTMITTVTGEDFGTEEETSRYAEDIVSALVKGEPLDFARAYFPMVLGGLIANTRVTMPREQVRETVFILSKALNQRGPEKNQDNAFIFDLTAKLIDRALDTT